MYIKYILFLILSKYLTKMQSKWKCTFDFTMFNCEAQQTL